MGESIAMPRWIGEEFRSMNALSIPATNLQISPPPSNLHSPSTFQFHDPTLHQPPPFPSVYHQHPYHENPYYLNSQMIPNPYYTPHHHFTSPIQISVGPLVSESSEPWKLFEERDQMRRIVEQKLELSFYPMDWCVNFERFREILLERYPELADDLSSPLFEKGIGATVLQTPPIYQPHSNWNSLNLQSMLASNIDNDGISQTHESLELENRWNRHEKESQQSSMEEFNQNITVSHVPASSKVSSPITFQICAPLLPPLSSESPPQGSWPILPSITTTRHSKPIEKSIENTIIHHTHNLFDIIPEPIICDHSKLIQAYSPHETYHNCCAMILPPPRPPSQPPDNDWYLLAKSYFDCKEYRRAAHVLRDQTGKRVMFLRCYALYMAGEKHKEEEMVELEGPLGRSDTVNHELVSLERELSTLRKNGLVLKERGSDNLARTVLVESVNSYPWNWNACLKLQSLCTTIDILNGLNLNNHWMKDFFIASDYQELRRHSESLTKYEYLQGTFFSFSNYIQAQIAKAQYSLREFETVKVIFEELLRNEPYRVEDMDMYSNVFYAKECFSALSYLAHRVFMTDKYRPESCCIIGNYYSLKGQHEKSVMYFRRALKLNKSYLSAWTLMGHEYVEMKNTPAAIDAYRRAVDINPCYYRAWYGLGQAYEMMGMPFYALHYFRKSVFLQPNDSQLWIAMAQCYETEQLHMLEEAIKCYRRAANCNDREAIALHQLAKLHCELGRAEEAAFYYKEDLDESGKLNFEVRRWLLMKDLDQGMFKQRHLGRHIRFSNKFSGVSKLEDKLIWRGMEC